MDRDPTVGVCPTCGERWLWVDSEGSRPGLPRHGGEDRALGRARVWLADHGYTPIAPRSHA